MMELLARQAAFRDMAAEHVPRDNTSIGGSSSSRFSLTDIHQHQTASSQHQSTEEPSSFPRAPLCSYPSYLSVNSSNTNSAAMSGPHTHINRSESRAESISTLWSSADIPLFLDPRMDRRESTTSSFPGPSRIFMSPPKGTSSGLQSFSSSRHSGLIEMEELTGENMDAPQPISSPPSSISGDAASRDYPRRQSTQVRPPPLVLAPPPIHSGIPASISHGSSQLTMKKQKSQTQKELPPPHHPHLYQEAEKFFSKSYTMTTPPLTTQSSFAPDNDSEEGKVVSPSCSYSRDSRSSTDSSMLPEMELVTGLRSPTLIKSISKDVPSLTSPLRVAVGLTTNHVNRPYTTEATSVTRKATGAPPTIRQLRPAIRHTHTTSDQEVLRQMQRRTDEEAAEQSKYRFLHSPAPTFSGKKLGLFGAKLRTVVSSPKLRGDNNKASEGNELSSMQAAAMTATESNLREQQRRDSARGYPPQAPSGRFGSRAHGEDELANSLAGLSTEGPEDSRQSQSRRPSSSDAFSALANRLRRPSKTATISSSHYNSSVTSFTNLQDGYRPPTAQNKRGSSSASSQMNLESRRRSSASRPVRRASTPKVAPTTPNQSKTKSGWASHLTQGITLHIEQGAKKYALKMDYLSYDPFGKPESLCASDDRHTLPRVRSKSGLNDKEVSSEDSVGLLEFGPCMDGGASGLPTCLTLDATVDAPVLKHLVIGDDVKGDLITRQANLTMCNIGTREVSGSERKGKVTWRLVYGVEDCRLETGEVVTGMKTMRALSFFCSATLLDPSRAKKSRMMNMIRKQIGSHIESMPMQGASTILESPASSRESSSPQSYRNITPPSPAAQLRSGLVPFKVTRPMLEVLAAQNRHSSEFSSTSASFTSNSPRVTSTHMTSPSVLLPSPLSSSFPNQARDQCYHHYPTTVARIIPSQEQAATSLHSSTENALGLHKDNNSGLRRVQTVTSQRNTNKATRQPTASEEIKQRYLLSHSRSDHSVPTLSSLAQRKMSEPNAQRTQATSSNQNQNQQHYEEIYHQSYQQPSTQQYLSHRSPRPSTSSQVKSCSSPVRAFKNQRPTHASEKFEAPEGPFWL